MPEMVIAPSANRGRRPYHFVSPRIGAEDATYGQFLPESGYRVVYVLASPSDRLSHSEIPQIAPGQQIWVFSPHEITPSSTCAFPTSAPLDVESLSSYLRAGLFGQARMIRHVIPAAYPLRDESPPNDASVEQENHVSRDLN